MGYLNRVFTWKIIYIFFQSINLIIVILDTSIDALDSYMCMISLDSMIGICVSLNNTIVTMVTIKWEHTLYS